MDLHTTNGSRHAYMLTYSPPLHPGTHPSIVSLLRQEWLPRVTASIREKHGWEFYHYGNVSGGGRRGAQASGKAAAQPAAERRWTTFDHRPRFNNNYVGLRNRFAVLSEAYAYARFQDRILATSRFLDENLAYVNAHAARIRQITDTADRSRIIGSRLPLGARLQHTGTIEILMGAVAEEEHPVDGHVVHVRKDVKNPERMANYSTFAGTGLERVPAAYYVPSHLAEALDRLSAHGIAMRRVTSPVTASIEEFRVDAVELATAPFQNRTERTLNGAWIAGVRVIPPGTMAVDMSGSLARLAFYLLEPRSDDGLANWDLLGEAVAASKVYPIVRSRD
jgi:hypothetical protein